SPAVADVKGLRVEDFESEEYLVPVVPDDPLLQIDWEEEEEEEEKIEEWGDTSLKERLELTEKQLLLTRTALDNVLKDLNQMKETMRELTTSSTDPDATMETAVEEKDSYFSNYGHHGIHEEMLKDEVRMDSYELFITKNTEIFKDKRLARENGVDNKITFIRGEVESVRLPVDSVDVLISEWMGYFLLFESMLDTVLYARDKWLIDKKNVYPNRCNMSLVAMGDGYEYNSKIKFWENAGFKMSCMKDEVLLEPTVKLVDEYCLISTSDVIQKFDITTVKVSDLDFKSSFMLTIKQNDTCYVSLSMCGFTGFVESPYEA
uniref:Protein arginine N-methyltransferase domain-containing protein n=1 Tax=Amphimedon queenslandica TaxID=400682 RepID=A0A1X7TBP3_AMPQE